MRFGKIKKQETHYRTINGRTEEVTQDVWVRAPSAPFDWDSLARKIARAVTAFVFVATLVWSAIAIGDTLDRVGPTFVAYMVGVVFDLCYGACTLLEWVSRYESDKVAFPRAAGWAALGVSMAMIILHSGLEGDETIVFGIEAKWIIGGFGALVCLASKILLTAVVKQMSGDLDPITEKALQKRRSELQASLAVLGYLREEQNATAQLHRANAMLGLRVAPNQLALPPGRGQANRTEDSPDSRHGTGGQPAEDSMDRTEGTPLPSVRACLRELLTELPELSRDDAWECVRGTYGPDVSDPDFNKKVVALKGNFSRSWTRARQDLKLT